MLDAIKTGDPIPLNLQLFDGKTDRVVKATLVNQAGATIAANVVLTHSGLGLYQSNSQTMPEADYVAVTYIVYDVDGTTEDTSYNRSQDVYYRAKDIEPAVLSGSVSDLNLVTGAVSDLNELDGEVED